jgi:hypothetical protein
MTGYGTDSGERTAVPVIIAFVSIAIAWVVGSALAAANVVIPWYLDAPSPLALFGILMLLFDRWVWRLGVLRAGRLVRVPDLTGTWTGTLHTNFDQTPRDVTLRIHQTWRTILIVFETNQSRSRSRVAAIFTSDPEGAVLTYQYVNDPNAATDPALQTHLGTSSLRLAGGNRLIGDYYSGRGRSTYGEIDVRR